MKIGGGKFSLPRGGSMNCLFGLLIVISNYNFNCLTKFPEGITTESVPILIGDTNHNGWYEIIFGHSSHDWFIFEYQPINSYNEVFHPWGEDTMFTPVDVGDSDKDGLTDILGYLHINVSSTQWPGSAILENKNGHSYPDSLTWVAIDTNGIIWLKKITDMDSDNKMELFGDWIGDRITLEPGGNVIYENQGDNYFLPAWVCTTGSHCPVAGGPPYVFGDFDGDGKQEYFASGGSPMDSVFINEWVGNDGYKLTWSGHHELYGMFDAWLGNDTDHDGKPEIFMKNYWYGPNPAAALTMWEATGDNSYELTEIDTITGYIDPLEGRSTCGDVDGDSVDEVIASVGTKVIIYKATGDNKYERVWEWTNDFGSPPYSGYQAVVACHDFNKNGYEELVISGNDQTAVFEIDKTSIAEAKLPSLKPVSLSVVPNIIRNSAIIKYTVPAQGKVELVVYDPIGRTVKKLVDKELRAGVYTVNWMEKELPAGIYFCKLQIGKQTAIQKVVLLR